MPQHWLPNSIDDAKFLSADEKQQLRRELARDTLGGRLDSRILMEGATDPEAARTLLGKGHLIDRRTC